MKKQIVLATVTLATLGMSMNMFALNVTRTIKIFEKNTNKLKKILPKYRKKKVSPTKQSLYRKRLIVSTLRSNPPMRQQTIF